MKILCHFDYGAKCYTGFATVSRNIKKHLKTHFGNDLQLDIVAINHYDNGYVEKDGSVVISAKMNDVKSDDFGRFIFLKIIAEDTSYDGIFIIQDLGVVQSMIPILSSIMDKRIEEKKKRFKSIFYFPVDCKLIPILLKGMEFFDKLVTYTEFGRAEVLNIRPDLKEKLSVINHGNNSNDFYQIDSQAFRTEFFHEAAENFIVTMVNRNQPRKDIPNTIFGFIEAKRIWYSEGLPRKPFLYLHCHPNDPLGWNIRQILMQTELEEFDDYMLLPKKWETTMCSIEELNCIYNASDLLINTTLGEGWGLSVTEAMAVKLPVLVPYNTSLMEITGHGKRGYLLETQIPWCGMNDNIVREQTDYAEVGQKIVEVAKVIMQPNSDDQTKEHQKKLFQAYSYVCSLEWSQVCKRWIELFKSTY